MSNMFKILTAENIEEKIRLNKKDRNYTPEGLLKRLKFELFQHQRDILKEKYSYTKRENFSHKDLLKVILPYEIQSQNLREQIDYIAEKIKKEK